MTSIVIRAEDRDSDRPHYRAVAGSRESVGRTMGEALDALTADWSEEIQETVVLIRRFQPDSYFTQAQYDRMRELLTRRTSLTADERAELESLIDAELEATVARTDDLLLRHQP